MRPLAFDTETINRPGHGEACQLIAETASGEIEYVNFPESFTEIFNFMIGGKYIAFNADFDVRAIIHPKFVQEKTLEQIAEYDCGIWNRYRFFSIPGKYFKCWARGRGGSFEIFDIKSFFQGHSLDSAAEKFLHNSRKINLEKSLSKALRRHISREQAYSSMDVWLKDKRTAAVVTEYACRDVQILSELYGVLEKSFMACGIPEPSLYSPGSASMEIFGDILKENLPGDEVNTIFRKSYFGGRIEVAEMGRVC